MSEVMLVPMDVEWLPKSMQSFHINQTNIEVIENKLQDDYYEVLCYNTLNLKVYCHYVLKGEYWSDVTFRKLREWIEDGECPSCDVHNLSIKDIYPELPMEYLVKSYQTGDKK